MTGFSRARLAACTAVLAMAMLMPSVSAQRGTPDLPEGDALKRIPGVAWLGPPTLRTE